MKAPAGDAVFVPKWVSELELAEPLRDLVAASRDGAGAYAGARLLVRLHGQPLGFVDVPLSDGRARAEDLLTAIRVELAEPIALHLEKDGLDRAEPSTNGLPGPPAPACLEPGSYGEREPFMSVVVPTRERVGSLRRCIAALLTLDYSHYDVIVVDSAPMTDATAELVFALDEARVRYLLEPLRGLSRARNRGAREARGKVVAFTDDDVLIDPQWLRGLARGFTRAPEVGCVTGFVPTAELDSESQLLFEKRVSWGRSCQPRLFDVDPHPIDDPLYPYIAGVFGTGANFAVSRSTFEQIGGFDEALGAGAPARGGEDLDFFLRTILAGKQLAYEPGALAWHVHRRDGRALRRQLFGYGSGLTAYAFKHLLLPRNTRDVARRLPGGLRRLVKPYLASPSTGLPARLRAVELGGALAGPSAYLVGRSRRWRSRRA